MTDSQSLRGPLFETRRLRCRRWIAEDIAPLIAVYGDADAMRWVGDGKPLVRAQCEAWLQVTANNYRDRGYGMFALEDRTAGTVVGFCGLIHPGGQPEAEVKYAFLRTHWGRGLATEALKALLVHGAQVHGLDRVIATVAPAHLASRRVLLKSGMVIGQPRRQDEGNFTQLFEWLAPRHNGP